MLIFFGLWWAITIPLTKIAVSTGHQPIGLIYWQLIIAATVLFLVLVIRRRGGRKLLRLDRQALGHYLAITLLGTIIPNCFSYVAAAQLPAGIMAIIVAAVPMFAMLIALLVGLERYSGRRLLGVMVGGAAVVVLVGPDASLPDPEKAVFVLVALIAPFAYGLEGNYLSLRSFPDIDPVAALAGASIIGATICLPIAWFGGYWVDLTQPWGAAEQALIISSLIHALTYCGYIWLVGKTSAVFASQIAYVVTLGGVLASAIVLSESYSWWVLLSLLLMLVGLSLVQPRAPTNALAVRRSRPD